ncbi:MAG: copper transporter [Actinomycetota bacterium]
MISWRYHLVSIVAVFLALALGVLAGTAVVNQGLISTLKTRTDASTKESVDLRKALVTVTTDRDHFRDYSDTTSKFLEHLRLSQAPVVLVADGADPAFSQVRSALSEAGANVVTTLVPLPSLVSTDPGDMKALAGIIGSPGQPDPPDLSALANRLAIRLKQGPPATGRPEDDVLAKLLLGGFMDSQSSSVKTASDIGTPVAVIVIGGATEGARISPASFLVPLVQDLSNQGMVVAAGEANEAPNGFVSLVRSDSAGAGPRVTVDDLAASPGGTALVLGLQRAIDQGLSGDYGTASGVSLLPPLT